MNISSTMYRGHEIVRMPSGMCLIHKGDRSGPLVGDAPNDDAAMALVDRLKRQERGAPA